MHSVIIIKLVLLKIIHFVTCFTKENNLQTPLVLLLMLYKVLTLVKAHDLYLVLTQQETTGLCLREGFQVSSLTGVSFDAYSILEEFLFIVNTILSVLNTDPNILALSSQQSSVLRCTVTHRKFALGKNISP